jgi:UDP-N-acetylglucosamine 2-epimerase (non-hydrolysing)
MPEEINRIVTDSISDFFFTTTEWASNNLRNTGVRENQLFFVGNIMIDTLIAHKTKLVKPKIWDELKLETGHFIMMTLHRPANVDDPLQLKQIIETVLSNVEGVPVIFPIHPRTAGIYSDLGIESKNMYIVDPMGYLEFNFLVSNSKAVITDSGGITEEATVYGVPCLTLRNNTERPETCEIGTNELVGVNPEKIKSALKKLFAGNWKKGSIPELWDGNTADRIVKQIELLARSAR